MVDDPAWPLSLRHAGREDVPAPLARPARGRHGLFDAAQGRQPGLRLFGCRRRRFPLDRAQRDRRRRQWRGDRDRRRARDRPGGDGDVWRARLSDGHEVTARAIVNAAGPGCTGCSTISASSAKSGVRLVKGSHIVVPRLYEGDHAYILQLADRRIVFAIPYQGEFTEIGTTDIPVEHPEDARRSATTRSSISARRPTAISQGRSAPPM